jgi:N-acetylglucosaminyldiphosphoundecaprenol N-acetyl-beta-D-mannosaminyltransferase
MRNVTRVNILGCPVDAVTLDETIAYIRDAVTTRSRLRLVAINVDQAMKARRDEDFGKVLWQSDIAFADGVPIVWSASLLGSPIKGRVAGTDLVWRCAGVSAETGSAMALVGAGPGVAGRAAARMREQFPGARVVAIDTPTPLGAAESQSVIQAIREADAQILFAALGAPRQERWIEKYLPDSGAAVGAGVGSAFDLISGDQPRAPLWMQARGLEWLHRLLQEPSRLGRRYFIEDAPFVWHLASAWARRLVQQIGNRK